MRASVGMKGSFAIGMCIQFITFVIYVILYQHITNHNRNMFQYEVISKDTYRVIINYYISVSYAFCVFRAANVLLTPFSSQNHIFIMIEDRSGAASIYTGYLSVHT